VKTFKMLVFVCLATAGSWAQTPLAESAKPVAEGPPNEKAVQLVRVLNTAESVHFKSSGKYGGIQELRDSGAIKEASERMKHFVRDAVTPEIDDADILKHYSVSIQVSNSGKAYALIVKAKKVDELSFVSTEDGLIYRAAPLQ
jgi:hypothetical protein